MDSPQPEQIKPPQPIDHANLAKSIYPSPTVPTNPVATMPATNTSKANNAEGKPLIGIAIIAGLILFSTIYSLLAFYRLKNYTSGSWYSFSLIFDFLSVLLAIGLLGRKEIARLLIVILNALNLAYAALLFISISSNSGGAKHMDTRAIVDYILALVVVVYLTRPSVKDQFS
jgi:hypothetical protein